MQAGNRRRSLERSPSVLLIFSFRQNRLTNWKFEKMNYCLCCWHLICALLFNKFIKASDWRSSRDKKRSTAIAKDLLLLFHQENNLPYFTALRRTVFAGCWQRFRCAFFRFTNEQCRMTHAMTIIIQLVNLILPMIGIWSRNLLCFPMAFVFAGKTICQIVFGLETPVPLAQSSSSSIVFGHSRLFLLRWHSS